jgi:hypothetical protein
MCWRDRAVWGQLLVKLGKSSRGTHDILPCNAKVAAWTPIVHPARGAHPC